MPSAPGANESVAALEAAWRGGLPRPAGTDQGLEGLRIVISLLQRLSAAGLVEPHEGLAVARFLTGAGEYLVRGGDLAKRLGIQPKRGRRPRVPGAPTAIEQRDRALRGIADTLSADNTAEQARLLRDLIATRDPRTLVLHELQAPVPSSERHLVRILHGTAVKR